MDETTSVKDPLPAKGPASEGKEGSTSSNPRTYTEEEHRKAVSDSLAKAGRDAKAIEAREAKLKDIETREARLKTAEAEAKKKAEESEYAAVKDDPEKLTAYELHKKAREEAEAVRLDREKLEAERQAFQAKLTRAEELERAAEIALITQKYSDGDPDKLANLCERLNLTSKEQIEAAAEIIFTQNPGEAFKPDSGVTKGGALDYSRMKPEDKFRLGLEAERKNKK
jgi:hypothetical protein